MLNNYDVAVLSEKVAHLEAAIKNAGIELPEVTSEDNGKTLQVVNGAWGTGETIPTVPDVINALDSTSTTDALSAAQGKVLNDKITEIKVSSMTITSDATGGLDFSSLGTNVCVLQVKVIDNESQRLQACVTLGTYASHWFGTLRKYTDLTALTSTQVDLEVYYI